MRPSVILEHPCFQEKCHGQFGRIHLPVAPKCTIQCAFCDRKYDCVNESRPGVASKIITPKEALERTAQALQKEPADPRGRDRRTGRSARKQRNV